MLDQSSERWAESHERQAAALVERQAKKAWAAVKVWKVVHKENKK